MHASSQAFRLPGLTDMHVHLRDPGQTHKEDFLTGTSAALAGGFTEIFDMPNNAAPITTPDTLDDKRAIAQDKIVCDTGLYYGSLGDNLDTFTSIQDHVSGLKLYLNTTTGGYKVDTAYITKIFAAWHSDKPVLLHAEADVINIALKAAKTTGQRIHVCHVSCRAELEPIIQAKDKGIPVTCGVTPHHLFLTDKDREKLMSLGAVKPELKPQADVDYLWRHLDAIDAVESDHAPHTLSEKEQGTFGFPGLETTLPLLLQAEHEGRITRAAIIEKLSIGPRKILGLPPQNDTTFIEVIPTSYIISSDGMHSRSAWTPFAGQTVFGKVSRVTLRGAVVFEYGKVLAKPGSGHVLS